MGQTLPPLNAKSLGPTRNRLQAAAFVIGNLQRAFLPKNPHDWHYGLEVTMRGLSTQVFKVDGEDMRASIDLVRNKVRLDGHTWPLRDYDGLTLFIEVQAWLKTKGLDVELERPEFSDTDQFEPKQVEAYADALWWLEAQFRKIKASLKEGLTAPILLYPHHFDLSLVWFPQDDEKQLSLGWSTGDETIAEPYLYLGAYPEPNGFTDIKLPDDAHWQSDGFTAAILPYAKLQASDQPAELLQNFAADTMAKARPLLD